MSRDFNGTSDYLDCSAGVLTTFPFSISAWVNPDVLTGSDRDIFASHDNPGVGNVVLISTNSGDSNKAQFWLFDGDYDAGERTTAGISTGSWQNIIAVATSASAYSIWLNNGSIGSNTVATSITLSALNRMTIGRSSFAAQNYFDGKIAHVAVWDNYALTSQDRTDLQTKGPLLLSTQPTLYLPLTSNTNPEPDDAGSNDFNVNGATFSSDNPTLTLTVPAQLFGASVF